MKIVFIAMLLGWSVGIYGAIAQEGYTARTIGPAIWESAAGADSLLVHRAWELTEVGAVTDAGAVYRASSSFPANPTNNRDQYQFDFKISQHVTTPQYTGHLVYYINSADGSIAFTVDDNPVLRERLGIIADQGELHFGIRKADGNVLICGRYKDVADGNTKRGMDIGKNRNIADLWMESYMSQMQWLNDDDVVPSGVRGLTTEQLTLIEDAHITGRRASYYLPESGRDQVLDLFFIDFPVPIATSMPFMGLGVGVFKNFRLNINQLAVFSAFHQVPLESGNADLYFWLNSIHKAEATFRPGEYVVMTAFNRAGMEGLNALTEGGSSIQNIAQRISDLQRQRSNCPDGEAGQSCREAIDRQVKELQQQAENMANELMEKYNIPKPKPRRN